MIFLLPLFSGLMVRSTALKGDVWVCQVNLKCVRGSFQSCSLLDRETARRFASLAPTHKQLLQACIRSNTPLYPVKPELVQETFVGICNLPVSEIALLVL